MKCVELRCRIGLTSYTEKASAKEKQLFTEEDLSLEFTRSDLNNDDDDSLSSDDEDIGKSKRKKKKTKKGLYMLLQVFPLYCSSDIFNEFYFDNLGKARKDKSKIESDDRIEEENQAVENIYVPESFGVDKVTLFPLITTFLLISFDSHFSVYYSRTATSVSFPIFQIRRINFLIGKSFDSI